MIRRAVQPRFYAGDCAAQMDRFLAGFEPPAEPARPLAGIVPHAGWSCSGAVAAKVLKCFAADPPDAWVLFGAVHAWGVQAGAVYASGAWATPLGEVEVDAELAGYLLDQCPDQLANDPDAHGREHSIEVQTPMIKHLFPSARIVPIAMPPIPTAHETGAAVGGALAERGGKVALLGSTDFTHYGASAYGFAPWGVGPQAREKMRANDRRLIDLILDFRADQVVAQAREDSSACGAGAVAATVSAARAMGADQAALVEYTTSHDVLDGNPERFDMAVGYAGILFGAGR